MRVSRTRAVAWSVGLAALIGLLSWAGFALFRGNKPTSSVPYWRRNDWLSTLLRDADHGGSKGLASIHVPAGFKTEVAAGPELIQYPMFIAFDDKGRLFVCESAGRNIGDEEMEKAPPEMRIRVIEDTNGDGIFDRGKIFADKISMAMGALWYRGSLYVAAPPDVLRFEDTDGDGLAERREVVLTGWPLHSNGTTLHGPYLGPDGWMYLTYNLGKYKIKTKEGTLLEGPGGRVFRFRPDGTGLEWIIGGGFDNGIEIVFTPAGEMIGTMTYYNTPKLGERDALLHYVEGGVYPKYLPIVNQYKRTGELMPPITKFARVAPSGLEIYRGRSFGAGYRGNLFSALFNPHRVLRHIVERDGATFRSKDEDFLVSSDPDFHPTDVAEDADGSLLVVETGAWYLHSCPVSRIAKPEFKGAIYRVRREGAPRVDDPWGRALKLDGLQPPQLAQRLDDPRPAVRDKALDLLIARGEASLPALLKVRESHASGEVRAAAVFALGRIGTASAADAVRAALRDSDFTVRVAAARMAGMNRDREAVARLMELVRRDHPAVRRQAATALGQIGDTNATAALVAAAADPDDRFVEHAIIHSLILLKTPGPVAEALRSQNAKVRKAALIALDQMDGSPIRRQDVAAALQSGDRALRLTALWILSRHADWSGELATVVRARLGASDLTPDETSALEDTVVSFCENSGTQEMIASLASAGTPKHQFFVLDTMDRCPAKEFPAAWARTMRQMVTARDAAVRTRAIAIVRTHQVASLDADLEAIAANGAVPSDERALALGAIVARRPLAETGFRFLLEQLRPEAGADSRLSAAQVLGRARLSDAQRLALAEGYMANADPLVLPSLLEPFRGTRDEKTTVALVEALVKSPYAAEGIAAETIPALLENFSPAARRAATPLLDRINKQKDLRAERLSSLRPLLTGGDASRGRAVFFGAKAGCASCHTIMTEGAEVGPDLTGVGAVRSGLDLLEAIVYPSASFVPGHEVYRVETAGGVYTGVRGETTGDAVMLVSGPRDRVRIPRKDVISMRASLVSLMPDGFAESLTREELSDLLAFLQAQTERR